MGGWRRHSVRLLTTPAVMLLAGCASFALADRVPSLPQIQLCQPADDDRRWLGKALAAWPIVVKDFLKRPQQRFPQIVTYDSRCSYMLAAQPISPRLWTAAEHRGEITLPSGSKVASAPNAFNAVTGTGHNFVVFALPSIWRPVAPKSEIPLEMFLEGVMLHELAHSYQAAITPDISFAALLKRIPNTENLSDDGVQEAFGKNAAYARKYEAERNLLFRAASAPTDAEARGLACNALTALDARRARHFTGANAHWTLIDEMSLTTEGLGQWVAYKWLTQGRGLSRSLVMSKLRGPYWSQEQGLATFLIIDRLVPGWQRRLFSASPMTAEHLLALACRAQTGA